MTTQSDQRKAANLTQDQAARQAGVSVATWRRWERDPASVTPDVATQCQAALQGNTVDELLWDGMDKMLTAFGPDAPTDPGSRLTRALNSINDLLETSQELMAANIRPTDALRLRFGMAVMQATAAMALINPQSTYEDAGTAVQGLFPNRSIAWPTPPAPVPPYPQRDGEIIMVPHPSEPEGVWDEGDMMAGMNDPDTVYLGAHLRKKGAELIGESRHLYLRNTGGGWAVRTRQVGEKLPAELVEALIARLVQHQRDNPEPWAKAMEIAEAQEAWIAQYGTVDSPKPVPGHQPLLDMDIFAENHWTTWPTSILNQIVQDFRPGSATADPIETINAICKDHSKDLTAVVNNTRRSGTWMTYEPCATADADGNWSLHYKSHPLTIERP